MARQNSVNRSQELPIVLLGLRAAIRENDNVSPAQMLYGANIHIPGVFMEPTRQITSPEIFTNDLHKYMAHLSPIETEHHYAHIPFIHPKMEKSIYVFVRIDAIKKPLSSPYEGPFKVPGKHKKNYRIQLFNKTTMVSIDRLKPAFILH